ncbi:MAG: hypothetical protein M1824_000395 [Vezdaea acicularis]|nr:MAG: hypothetical protein M1824_000395 [Vezdaea acicularis]
MAHPSMYIPLNGGDRHHSQSSVSFRSSLYKPLPPVPPIARSNTASSLGSYVPPLRSIGSSYRPPAIKAPVVKAASLDSIPLGTDFISYAANKNGPNVIPGTEYGDFYLGLEAEARGEVPRGRKGVAFPNAPPREEIDFRAAEFAQKTTQYRRFWVLSISAATLAGCSTVVSLVVLVQQVKGFGPRAWAVIWLTLSLGFAISIFGVVWLVYDRRRRFQAVIEEHQRTMAIDRKAREVAKEKDEASTIRLDQERGRSREASHEASLLYDKLVGLNLIKDEVQKDMAVELLRERRKNARSRSKGRERSEERSKRMTKAEYLEWKKRDEPMLSAAEWEAMERAELQPTGHETRAENGSFNSRNPNPFADNADLEGSQLSVEIREVHEEHEAEPWRLDKEGEWDLGSTTLLGSPSTDARPSNFT